MPPRRSASVAITGMALASPFGPEPADFWAGVCQGPTPRDRWKPGPAHPGLAGMALSCLAAPLPEAAGSPEKHAAARFLTLATRLGREALSRAGLATAPRGCGLAFGSVFAEADRLACPRPDAEPAVWPFLAAELGLTGPVVGTPVNCAAGNMALAWAVRRIRAGHAPMMLAGGLDVIGPLAVGVYQFLGNLTEDLPRPFDADRDGILLSEGGACFVLEPLAAARAAGRTVLATIEGVGLGHDASHPTRPAPDGRGLARAMAAALADAKLPPDAVAWYNAHSPGTLVNDEAEAAAVRAVFGAHGVPVSSTKGALGHAQGGANALEAAVCVEALQRGQAPPTLNHRTPAPGLDIDHIAGATRPLTGGHVMSGALSLGGAAAVVIFGRGDAWA
jgi:3-oxoacyl-[acyl-carrier-protein] synthase II